MPRGELQYNVAPCEDALRDLRGPLPLPGRSSELPPVYLWCGDGPHPQRPTTNTVGNTFIIFIDPSPQGKLHAAELAKRQRIPLGREEDIQSLGLVKLHRGDMYFARIKDSDGDPRDDILQNCSSPVEHTPEQIAELVHIRDVLIGERSERTPQRVKFETQGYITQVDENNRVFGFGTNVQRQRHVVAPPAAAKVYDGALDSNQVQHKQFLSRMSTVMMDAWESTMPARWQTEIRAYSQVINSPVVGCDRNYPFPSLQLNITPAHDGDSDGSLTGHMKNFGKTHRDAYDFGAALSSMTTMSDIPDDEDQDPGRFHFLAHGFYITLEPWKTVFFSGLLPHGGTAPIAGPGKKAPHWAYRAVLIGYPPRHTMSGDARHALAALPYQSHPLYITPEITGVNSQYPNDVVETNYTNYASDGIMVMSRQSHFDFFIRSLLQLNIMLCRQLPRAYDVNINVDAFLDAFTGCSRSLRSTLWPLGPDGRVHREPDPTSARELVRTQFKETFYPYIARSIPSIQNEFPECSQPRRREKRPGKSKQQSSKELNCQSTGRKRKREDADPGPSTKRNRNAPSPAAMPEDLFSGTLLPLIPVPPSRSPSPLPAQIAIYSPSPSSFASPYHTPEASSYHPSSSSETSRSPSVNPSPATTVAYVGILPAHLVTVVRRKHLHLHTSPSNASGRAYIGKPPPSRRR